VRAFLNACRHKGALVCHLQQGNARTHTCQYHGWAYDSAGANVGIKLLRQGEYTPAFHAESHDLHAARCENYRGFLFVSLNPDVPPLAKHLGDMATFLDLIADQSPQGMELLPGTVTYTYRANWKFQVENTGDVYHFTSTHPSYIDVLAGRKAKDGAGADTTTYARFREKELVRGSMCFPHGHSAMWGSNPTPEARPLYASLDEVSARVGEARARWMLYVRNITVFPNVQFAENASLQMRVIRPLAPDLTEMTGFCLAAKSESPTARERRIRQYEDFFNTTGLATSDDNVMYEFCQAGYQAEGGFTQGYSRGLGGTQHGTARVLAQQAGFTPEDWRYGPVTYGDETCFHAGYREWRRLLQAGAR
jgi:benzoate/toluate 1,2-dioxygenase alpha subunit/2,4,5-trichlorophenoxyacetic acid oxygenase 1